MRRLTIALFFLAALCASAQEYTYTFTAPAGAVVCSLQSLTAYPINGRCPEMQGFVSPETPPLYKMELQDGQTITVLHITPVAGGQIQTVEAGAPTWTGMPSTFPPQNTPITLTMTASITAVCNESCVAASGTLDMTGQWSYQRVTVCGRSCRTYNEWTNATPLVLNGLSTVAILDKDGNNPFREFVPVADFRWPSWLRWLFGASEPVEIFF